MLRISKISFPGIGIGEFEVNSVAFTLNIGGKPFTIAWYAIIISIGMVLAVLYTVRRAKEVNISFDDIIDFVIFAIPTGIVGARLYYVFSKIESFHSFKEVINIRSGGLAIYGGIIGGAIAVLLVSIYKKIPFLTIADCCTPGIILAQSVGRWGNFMNGEAFGAETDIFIRMGLINDLTGKTLTYVHPTFLYESLWNLVGFVLINLFYKKRQYDGQVFLAVFGWYGLGRMLIEGLRQDSLYTTIFGITFRTSQILAMIIFLIAATILVFLFIKKYKKTIYIHPDKVIKQKRG